MEIFGETIQLFLMDGTPNGRWMCELSNWTGVAYKLPRTLVKESEARKELTSPGVYFLFGRDEEDDRPIVYIGEAENVIVRLKQHLDGKEFWNEVVFFITKDKNLNKAHVKYLEYQFYTQAVRCKRYRVENGITPTGSALSESEQATMKKFIYNVKMLVNALGHKVFEPIVERHTAVTLPLIEEEANTPLSEDIFYLSEAGATAKGMRTSEGFVLLQGSSVREKTSPSLSSGWKKRREKCREMGQISNGVLQNDLIFSSSTAAAAFVVGHRISGPQKWKDQDGKTLKIYETE